MNPKAQKHARLQIGLLFFILARMAIKDNEAIPSAFLVVMGICYIAGAYNAKEGKL